MRRGVPGRRVLRGGPAARRMAEVRRDQRELLRPAAGGLAETGCTHLQSRRGAPVRATGYFARSRLTLAGTRRQLAELADDLLEQAAEIRLQWSRLGDALRAAGVEGAQAARPDGEGAAALSSEEIARGPAS